MTDPYVRKDPEDIDHTGTYVYTDPVADPDYPRIREYRPGDDNPEWPEGWGATPTWRDQQAIDAGNG